jgi:hypothetical protein
MAHLPIAVPTTPRPPRLWPSLTAETQVQVAQLLATLLRRLQTDRPAPVEESRRADRRDRA